MAASATSDGVKLDRLRAAKKRAEGLKRSAPPMESQQFSELIGMRWAAVRDWIDSAPQLEAKGAVVRGGQGAAWKIKPVMTINLLIKHFEARISKSASRRRTTIEGAGVKLPEAETEASYTEMRQMVEMTMSITAAKERQGQFVRADEVRAFIEGYNQAVTSAILGVKMKVDSNGNLPPHLRAAVDEFLRGVASHVHAAATKFVKGQKVEGLQSPGTR